ncbi:hypothetical protein BD769DRAFT_1733922 [Suillus cothurnatus]|nr:hypothetical protein BD769DRAFT_1733922 [Suillus cothurnatus]
MSYRGSDSPNIVHPQPQGGREKSIERRSNLEQPKQVAGPATDVALRDLSSSASTCMIKCLTVLFIPELLGIIFNFVDEDDLVNNAWSEIAMDIIWREVDDLPRLLTLLRPYKIKGRQSFFEGLPDSRDWARFQNYANRNCLLWKCTMARISSMYWYRMHRPDIRWGFARLRMLTACCLWVNVWRRKTDTKPEFRIAFSIQHFNDPAKQCNDIQGNPSNL